MSSAAEDLQLLIVLLHTFGTLFLNYFITSHVI